MAKAAELDKDLVDGLKAAKSKPAYFVLVLKGATDGALIVSKTKVPPADIATAKKESGGTAVVSGFCSFEDGTYIFETAKQAPATAAQAVKVIAKRDAGLAVKAEFRTSSVPELVAADGLPAADDGTALAKRLAGMTPDIKAALAGPNKARVQVLFVAVSSQIKSKDFVSAAKGLDELAALLKPPSGADVIKRLNAMTADIKAALAGPNKARVHALFVAVSGQIKNNEFAQAAKGLDELEPLLSPVSSPPGHAQAAQPDQPDGMPADVALKTAAQAWETARLHSLADLEKLAKYILEDFADEPEFAAVSAKVDDIRALFDDFDSRVRDKLKEIVSTPRGDARRPLYQQAEIMLRAYRAQLNSPLIKNLDSNPFMPVKIHAPLYAAVAELAALVHL